MIAFFIMLIVYYLVLGGVVLLIMVLGGVAFKPSQAEKHKKTLTSFNPCFNGCST
jgi:hypothetical protein